MEDCPVVTAGTNGSWAWWSGTSREFLATDVEHIVGMLAQRLIQAHSLNHDTQLISWRKQVVILREVLEGLPGLWRVLLEYPLLRLGRRIDTVIIGESCILVLEFKVGSGAFTALDRRQAEDYALDLFDFHSASRVHPIVPILVSTAGAARMPEWLLFWHGVTPVFDASAESLPSLVRSIAGRIPPASAVFDAIAWEAAPYRPVPTIVEAATMLYQRHSVDEIAAARADVGNLTRTTDAIRTAIQEARTNGFHLILFVTGIPGAGKTLCGLNAVFGADDGTAFLTGNLPLVHVMREALARDASIQGRSLRMARQQTESAIQPLMGFLRDNLKRDDPPHEHVIVFDEAQRAWDAEYGRRKFDLPQSEAALFLDIMSKHRDWSVIVALVGNGQEINAGEAGLAAWGDALLVRPEWQVRAPPQVLTTTNPRERLFGTGPTNLAVDSVLHLDVPVRSIKSAAGSPWVDAVLRGDAVLAASIAAESGGVPFLITRSLADMRRSLRELARGTRRPGLVCSAGALRLRADGISPNFPHLDANAVAHWFLNRWPDVRASDALEVPATQFACQGLELDNVGLCWGNDLVRRAGGMNWVARAFRGTKWQEPRGEAEIAFKINTYRVLLTRARYETIIWVPEGSEKDVTRTPADFDAIADFLLRCGALPLSGPSTIEGTVHDHSPILL